MTDEQWQVINSSLPLYAQLLLMYLLSSFCSAAVCTVIVQLHYTVGAVTLLKAFFLLIDEEYGDAVLLPASRVS